VVVVWESRKWYQYLGVSSETLLERESFVDEKGSFVIIVMVQCGAKHRSRLVSYDLLAECVVRILPNGYHVYVLYSIDSFMLR
jgi:hypothetical protein